MSQYRQDVRKAVARLTTKAAQLSPGRGGGLSDETPAIIAMCLGAACPSIGERRAVALFCLKHWPGYANAPARQVLRRVELVHERIRRRLGRGWTNPDTGERVRSQAGPFETVAKVQRSVFTYDRITPPSAIKVQVLNWLELQIRQKVTNTDDWPPFPEPFAKRLAERADFWRTFTSTVFEEFCHPAGCQSCARTGKKATLIKNDEGKVKLRETACPDCRGKGLVARGQGKRAADLNLRKADFANHLEPAYRYLWLRTLQYEHVGASAILRALRDDWGDD